MAAPAVAAKWWTPFAVALFAVVLSAIGTSYVMTWSAATERADVRNEQREMRGAIQAIRDLLKVHDAKFDRLDQQDQSMAIMPPRMDALTGRVEAVEKFVDEARRIDRVTSNAITSIQGSISAISSNVGQLSSDVRSLLNERRGYIPPPSYRAEQPPSGGPAFRPN